MSLEWVVFHPFDAQLSEATQAATPWLYRIDPKFLPASRPTGSGSSAPLQYDYFVATKISWLERTPRKNEAIHAKGAKLAKQRIYFLIVMSDPDCVDWLPEDDDRRRPPIQGEEKG